MPPMTGDPHKQVLDALAAKGRLRALHPRRGLDFTSNDFLALAESRALREAARDALARGVPVGAGGSRLLRGNHPEHEALEEEAASFFGSETALYFPTGFAANAAIAATLPRPGDLIAYDSLIHASIRDGLDPARIAAESFDHNDVNALEAVIVRWRAQGGVGRIWIAVETLYSMDGDRAPLADLVALAARHDAVLLLDEAHATGVYGDFLVNRGRAFIYSTAPSPLMAAVVRAALKICAGAEQERTQLQALVRHAGGLMKSLGQPFSGSQIVPLILGADTRAVALADAMQARGHDIRAIRPPTVPEGTARLRIALTLHVTPQDLDALFADLALEMAKA
jgi:8-amino-7-oxononanoate synthase